MVTAAPLKSMAPAVVIDAPSVIGAVALDTVKLVSGVVPPTSALNNTVPVPVAILRVCAPLTVPSNVTSEFVVVRTIAPASVTAPDAKSRAETVDIFAFRVNVEV